MFTSDNYLAFRLPGYQRRTFIFGNLNSIIRNNRMQIRIIKTACRCAIEDHVLVPHREPPDALRSVIVSNRDCLKRSCDHIGS